MSSAKIALVAGSYKGLGLASRRRLATEKQLTVFISGRGLPKVQATQAALAKSGVAPEALALIAKELVGTDIHINAYSPGWLQTDMGGPSAPFSADEGTETALHLATLPAGGPSGKFFAEPCKFGGPIQLPW